MKALKPIATDITSWQPYKEVIYNCPKCGMSFRMFGNQELFCHNCGQKIDWDVIIKLKEPFISDDHEERKRVIAEINNSISTQ